MLVVGGEEEVAKVVEEDEDWLSLLLLLLPSPLLLVLVLALGVPWVPCVPWVAAWYPGGSDRTAAPPTMRN